MTERNIRIKKLRRWNTIKNCVIGFLLLALLAGILGAFYAYTWCKDNHQDAICVTQGCDNAAAVCLPEYNAVLDQLIEQDSCTTFGCGNPPAICEQEYNALQAQNAELTATIQQQQATIDQLNITIQTLQNQLTGQNGGTVCNGSCPVHCPEEQNVPTTCTHANISYNTINSGWKPEGKEDVCRYYVVTKQKFCLTCGTVFETSTERTDTDTKHDFGSDRVCDDCGYTKPNGGATTNPTQQPTVTPTPTPTAAPSCKHDGETRTEPVGDWVADESHNSATCCYEQSRKVNVYCKKCNAFLKEDTEVQVVTHDKTTAEETEWKAIGEKNKCRELVKTTKTYCKKCNFDFGTKTETVETATNHEKQTTVISEDWVLTCQEGTCRKKVKISQETCTFCKYDFGRTSEVVETDTTHDTKTTTVSENWVKVSTKDCCRKLVKVTKATCTTCKYDFGTNEQTVQVISEHEFSGRNCKHCDYKRAAAGEGYGEQTGTIDPVENEETFEDPGQAGNPID